METEFSELRAVLEHALIDAGPRLHLTPATQDRKLAICWFNPREAEHRRWNAVKDLALVPLRRERVVEVRYDHMEGTRVRRTAQFVRWRADRDPRSCGFDELEERVGFNPADILAQ